MSIIELFLIGVGLSMDAFAVSVCKGLSVKKININHILKAGLWFGGFQALMPFIGYILGTSFKNSILSFDHWVAFILLSVIGLNMIKESRKTNNDLNDSFNVKSMFPLAIATSIDALAVGISLALLPDVNIIMAISLIGVTTFIFSVFGIKAGNIFGAKYKSKSELTGGIILIIIGLKILLEHLNILIA